MLTPGFLRLFCSPTSASIVISAATAKRRNMLMRGSPDFMNCQADCRADSYGDGRKRRRSCGFVRGSFSCLLPFEAPQCRGGFERQVMLGHAAGQRLEQQPRFRGSAVLQHFNGPHGPQRFTLR